MVSAYLNGDVTSSADLIFNPFTTVDPSAAVRHGRKMKTFSDLSPDMTPSRRSLHCLVEETTREGLLIGFIEIAQAGFPVEFTVSLNKVLRRVPAAKMLRFTRRKFDLTYVISSHLGRSKPELALTAN